MLFNSIEFAVFFVIVYTLYSVLRRHFKMQNALLLAASYLFYGWWDVRFLFLIILTTCVDFVCAQVLERGVVSRRGRWQASGLLVLSAFLFVLVQWQAVTVTWRIVPTAISVDWAGLLPRHVGVGWWVLIGAFAAVLLVHVNHRLFAKLAEDRRRKVCLAFSVVVNLSILGFFKYFNFFAESFSHVIESILGVTPSPWTLNIILPVGISFYTFQSMSYTVDVYRRKMASTDSLMTYATYVTFFPQLVAGPIERGVHLLPQFTRPRRITTVQRREGAWLIVWGLFKKMVVADNMAIIVSQVFGPYDGATPSSIIPMDGLRMLVGVYAFAIQIYGDFSGYSDIARGTARLLGFDIMLNFNLPYFATSPSEFWTRWHISLSSWLRDYLYIPLGGNRGSGWFTCRNLFLTMLLGGLWHGAAWNFVLWGMFHGALLVAYRSLAGLSSGHLSERFFHVSVRSSWIWIIRGVQGLVMFHWVCLGWLLFRAQNIQTIRIFLQSIVCHPQSSPETIRLLRELLFYAWFLIVFQVVQCVTGTLDPLKKWHWFVRLNVWIFVVMSLLVFASKIEAAFIYFAF